MKITIIGAGFVGTATGMGLAKHGNDVVLIDVDPSRIKHLKKQGLNAKLASERKSIESEVTMLCVPTPTKGGSIQLNYIEAAVSELAELLKKHKEYHVIVIRSTVPPKTTRTIVVPLIEKISGKKSGKDFGVCM